MPTAGLSANALKAMCATKAPKLGHFIVEFATPGIGHILKSAGCDFVLFDTEHSGFGMDTIKNAVRWFEAAELPMICRVPSKDYHDISRALDMGAEGIMIPMVGSAKEARHLVDCMKYPPVGRRGVALQVAHDRYRPGGTLEKLNAANARTTLFAQIETAEGVDNVDQIAATDGVDCLWVGHFDLSASLGIPGDFGHKKFTDAIAEVVKASKKHKKALGRLVPTVESGIDINALGFDFVCYSGDVWVLHNALAEAIGKLREGTAANASAARSGKKK